MSTYRVWARESWTYFVMRGGGTGEKEIGTQENTWGQLDNLNMDRYKVPQTLILPFWGVIRNYRH